MIAHVPNKVWITGMESNRILTEPNTKRVPAVDVVLQASGRVERLARKAEEDCDRGTGLAEDRAVAVEFAVIGNCHRASRLVTVHQVACCAQMVSQGRDHVAGSAERIHLLIR